MYKRMVIKYEMYNNCIYEVYEYVNKKCKGRINEDKRGYKDNIYIMYR